MKKIEAFIAKHDRRILNVGTVLFLLPVMVFAFIGDIATSVSILGGYVAFGIVFSILLFGDVRRENRARAARIHAASVRKVA